MYESSIEKAFIHGFLIVIQSKLCLSVHSQLDYTMMIGLENSFTIVVPVRVAAML